MQPDREERVLLQRRQIEALRKMGAPTYQHAHQLVAKTAKEFAQEFYEGAAHDNAFYHHYPDRGFFVEREWHIFIPKAREILAGMLGQPGYPEAMKTQIFDALALDRTLPRPDNAYSRA